MKINPLNLIYHELIGLNMKVIESNNQSLLNIKGIVIDETKNTFKLDTISGIKKIPKAHNVFIFELVLNETSGISLTPKELKSISNSNSVGVKEQKKEKLIFVKVDGNLLCTQSENRIKNIKKTRTKLKDFL